MTTPPVARLAAGIAFDFLRVLILRPACAYCPKQAETTTRIRLNIPATKSIPVCAGCCDDYDGGIAGKNTYLPATARQIRAYARGLHGADCTLTRAGARAQARTHEAQRAAAHARRHTNLETS